MTLTHSCLLLLRLCSASTLYNLSQACLYFLVDVFQSHVETLEDQVKEQEAYHKELQEMERWLLQMSSRMVTPDPTVCGSLESATQQLASHKVSSYYSQQL